MTWDLSFSCSSIQLSSIITCQHSSRNFVKISLQPAFLLELINVLLHYTALLTTTDNS